MVFVSQIWKLSQTTWPVHAASYLNQVVGHGRCHLLFALVLAYAILYLSGLHLPFCVFLFWLKNVGVSNPHF